jgi:hypothetical protein
MDTCTAQRPLMPLCALSRSARSCREADVAPATARLAREMPPGDVPPSWSPEKVAPSGMAGPEAPAWRPAAC